MSKSIGKIFLVIIAVVLIGAYGFNKAFAYASICNGGTSLAVETIRNVTNGETLGTIRLCKISIFRFAEVDVNGYIRPQSAAAYIENSSNKMQVITFDHGGVVDSSNVPLTGSLRACGVISSIPIPVNTVSDEIIVGIDFPANTRWGHLCTEFKQ